MKWKRTKSYHSWILTGMSCSESWPRDFPTTETLMGRRCWPNHCNQETQYEIQWDRMDMGTAWHRGSIRTSHPAVPGSNLTTGKKWNPLKKDLPRWNVCRQKSFTKKTNFAEKKPHFEAMTGEKRTRCRDYCPNGQPTHILFRSRLNSGFRPRLEEDWRRFMPRADCRPPELGPAEKPPETSEKCQVTEGWIVYTQIFSFWPFSNA